MKKNDNKSDKMKIEDIHRAAMCKEEKEIEKANKRLEEALKKASYRRVAAIRKGEYKLEKEKERAEKRAQMINDWYKRREEFNAKWNSHHERCAEMAAEIKSNFKINKTRYFYNGVVAVGVFVAGVIIGTVLAEE